MARTTAARLFGAVHLFAAGGPLPAAGGWSTRSNGLTSLFIVAITIDGDNPERVFATTRGQAIWRSLDGGAT